jgi:pimeloyl-ACP methyl ester carboxylesterase
MPKTLVNGVNIQYQQAGSGPAMVLIHGLTGSLAVWQPRIVPALSVRFNVLSYDLRGHGQSDMPAFGYRTSDMSSDLLALLDHLRVERAHLVGHSIGGTIALYLAALHPDRVATLTISDSRIRALQPSQRLKDWAYWPLWKSQLQLRGIVLDDDSEMDFLLLSHLAPSVPVSVAAGATSLGAQSIERWNRLLATTTAKADFKDIGGLDETLIRRVRTPAHAIYGEYSFCLPSLAGLRRLLANLQVTMIPRAGHFYPINQPDAFLSRLQSYYDGPHQRESNEATGSSTPADARPKQDASP